MTIHPVTQGSPEWHKLRLGKITSSRVKRIFGTKALELADELIAEKECPEFDLDGFESEDMARGKELEPLAREEYIRQRGVEIIELGFATHDIFPWLGMSPDGLTPDHRGGIEIKCPRVKTHVRYIRQDKIPSDYLEQVQQFFLVNPEQEWVDFVSFCPKFPKRPIWIKRMERKDVDVNATMNKVVAFWNQVEKLYEQVTTIEF